MKKILIASMVLIAVLGILFSISGSAQQAADPGVLLRAGIEKEEVDGDLKGAIVLYRQIIEKHGNNASVAARALYRLGWCHERLGNQEARNAYRRIIDEYPGQKEQVAQARARLAELDATAANASRKPTFRKIRISANPGNGVLSPDGRKFAFASQGSVWVVPIPGLVEPDLAGEPVRLTEPIDAFNMVNTTAWSGDGKWIAFTTNNRKENKSDIYVVSSKGGEPTKIAFAGRIPQSIYSRISLSEDGRRLAFSSRDKAAAANPTEYFAYFLYSVPVRGGTASRLVDFNAYQPAFSPDGRKIAFAQIIMLDSRNTKEDLWIINSDGSAPLRLTDSPGCISGPVWSPDGRMIAFQYAPPGPSQSREICIIPVPADGKAPGEPTRIELPSYSNSMLAGWTADNNIGILLANPVYQAVYTVPASGGKATQVTPKAGDIETYPCYPKWSHDGKMLYLRRGYGEIVSVPAQGGKFTVVQDSVGTALPGMGNAISPDGKTIVFAGGKRGDQPLGVGIWTVPVAGGEAKKITQSPTQDRYPCWSPDGKSVAFLRYTPGADGIPQIFVTSSNGGAVRQITSGSNNVGLGSIDWSPDGKTIAYFSRDYKISLIHAEGGEHKVLLDVGSSNRNWFSDLAWSPDGNELAYTSGDQLMVVSLKSGQTREVQTGVLDKGIQNFYIDWSPDGSKLAFSAGSGGDEELWLMEDFLHLVKK